MGAREHEFMSVLFTWRDATAVQEYGEAWVQLNGPEVFMLDDVVLRIVDCAHAGKPHFAQDLHHETKWDLDSITDHWPHIESLIKAHWPDPAPNAEPAPPSEPAQVNAPMNTTVAKRKCGACGREGHQRAYIRTYGAN
jgi:hypothetical protein